MAIVQHVKIVSPDPAAVYSFLVDVVGLDGGGNFQRSDQETDPSEGPLTWERVMHLRAASQPTGYIAGTPMTRQFQILGSDQAALWASAIATRDVEAARSRCLAAGIEVTETRVTKMGANQISACFARVGGVIFELMQVL